MSLRNWLRFKLASSRASAGGSPPSQTGQTYPWYATIEGSDLEQGDILENCPVFLPPENLSVAPQSTEPDITFDWEQKDLIVMSQSCDLVNPKKVEDVLLCAVWKRSEITTELSSDSNMENARQGRYAGFHVLNSCDLKGFEREVRIVDFRRVYSLPIGYVRARALSNKRLRLLPPYREHLSQSFARFFMRVGLPIDIPPFTKKKKS